MQIQSTPPIHLTYCLNIPRGETWEENLAAIREHACRVRDRVRGPRPLPHGAGRRPDARAR